MSGLTEQEYEEVRRMAYAGSFSQEKAARYVATVERIVARHRAEAKVEALREAATALERRAGDFKHLAGDKHVRRTHNDIACWLRGRAGRIEKERDQ